MKTNILCMINYRLLHFCTIRPSWTGCPLLFALLVFVTLTTLSQPPVRSVSSLCQQKKKRRMTGVWASPSGAGRIPSLRPSMQKRPQNRRLCGKTESDENFVKSPSLSLTTLLIQFAIFLPCALLMRSLFPSPRPVLWRASAPPSIPWSAVRSVLQSPYSAEWPTSKYLRAT